MELDGISYAIARLATDYGPRQRTDLESGVVAIFAERLRKNLPVTINGTGEQSRDFVHVAGVVDALLVMAGSRIEGSWNVGTGRVISILELLRALEVAIRPAVEVRHGPARHGDVRSSRLSIEAIERDLGRRPSYDLVKSVAAMA
jgi:UDP-glucose 4-epimerase